MSDYASKYPLLAFMDILQGWADSVRQEHFWQEGNNIDHVIAFEPIRAEAKQLILWMELRDLEDKASRLDAAMQKYREAVWSFQHQCDNSPDYPPENEDCEQLRQAMAHEAEIVSGCAEDMNDEIDSSIWEGFDNA